MQNYFASRALAAQAERARLRAEWPDEFADGARRGFLNDLAYPSAFMTWAPSKRDAWHAGRNIGRVRRLEAMEAGR
jgi:hypothetical protein